MKTDTDKTRRIIFLTLAVVLAFVGLILLLFSGRNDSYDFLAGICIGITISITVKILFTKPSKKIETKSTEAS